MYYKKNSGSLILLLDLFIGDFRNLVDVNFCCAMGPPGGGRNPVSARLLRHFNFIAFAEMEDTSKRKIFGSIFKSWVGKYPDLFPFNA